MNLEKRFIEITQFLKGHEELFQNEALDFYNKKIPEKYEDWIDEIISLPDHEKINLESHQDYSFISNRSYFNFLLKRDQLCSVDSLRSNEKLKIPQTLTIKLTQKKIHEIQNIKGVLDQTNSNMFIDIGSGAGHLSSVLLFNNSLKSLCIDSNQDYQLIGSKKLSRFHHDILDRISFKNIYVDEKTHINQDLILPDSTLLGLHCCGNLSNTLIQFFKNNNSIEKILSFGCCYHKLSAHEQNISKFSQLSNPIVFTNFSLTMAAKQNYKTDKQLFQHKIKVKFYRYSLHMLSQNLYSQAPTSIGNGTKDDYQMDFAAYFKKYIPEAKNTSSQAITQFFNSNDNQILVKRIIALGIIRSHFARLIETLIIIDRAIFIKENGYNVTVKTYFDEKISPRNLGIFSSKS